MRATATCTGWLLLLSGCGVALQAGRPTGGTRGALVIPEARAAACPRSPGGAGQTFRQDLPGDVTDPERQRVLSVLPAAARRTALAAGLLPMLADLLLARERAGNLPTLETVAMRQQLDARVASLQPQLLAMEFEVECMIALMNDALDDHADRESAWALHMTVASLVAGAAAGLGAGFWDLSGTQSDGPVIVGLAGAGATTALGVAALVPPGHGIVFLHEHNVLAPLERGEDPGHVYPTFVFRLLTLPTATSAPPASQRLVTAWREALAQTVAEDERATADAMLWGAGGLYHVELLALRRRMYEELESTLDSYARDVDLLAASIAHALDRPGPAPAATLGSAAPPAGAD